MQCFLLLFFVLFYFVIFGGEVVLQFGGGISSRGAGLGQAPGFGIVLFFLTAAKTEPLQLTLYC